MNPGFVRPNDNLETVGTPYKIETELGWKRKWGFKDTIKDIIVFQEQQCNDCVTA